MLPKSENKVHPQNLVKKLQENNLGLGGVISSYRKVSYSLPALTNQQTSGMMQMYCCTVLHIHKTAVEQQQRPQFSVY